MMDRATSRQYSMCSLLFLMTFSSVYNQEFSTNVTVWVDHCVLHTNYTAPAGNGTCSAYKYRVSVNMYTKENKKIYLSTIDTSDLKYSYNGINSSNRYGIEVNPALKCLNLGLTFGEIREKNVIALAETSPQTVLAAEAEDLSILCPFHGAYKSYTVIKWQHILGINKIVVRNFTTIRVNLVNITYEDSGMYYCTVEYYPCGSNSRGPMYKEGFVSVNFEGPPVIASVMRTIEGDNISLIVQVVSFPQPPRPTIALANGNGHKVKVNSSGFVPVVFQYPAYGQSVKVSGYETKITIRNMSVEWLGQIKVFVTNGHGTQEYTVTTTNDDREKKKTLAINHREGIQTNLIEPNLHYFHQRKTDLQKCTCRLLPYVTYLRVS
ncbi:uncharacterized protein LOC125680691 isoform X2 [Ostrea edulis]|uniref:uncharacterized protein LOC125680691 isoform X2 n=1 Tax=Ostrea edulis TaxID=37623 RepID=UPI0024AF3A76|nr:uncharacterized protein LOC125680691 isoform X2 [Ostrea edulis]